MTSLAFIPRGALSRGFRRAAVELAGDNELIAAVSGRAILVVQATFSVETDGSTGNRIAIRTGGSGGAIVFQHIVTNAAAGTITLPFNSAGYFQSDIGANLYADASGGTQPVTWAFNVGYYLL